MKKAMKKLMAALLVVAMVCAMAIPAFAADGGAGTYTITISNPVGTYEAYQIFSGKLNGQVLSNIDWGTGVSNAVETALGSAKDKAKTLNNEDAAKNFATEVSNYLDTPSGTYDTTTGKITGLTAGYYLVKNSYVGENETYTSFILAVVNDVTVSPKSDKPTLEKKVKDANDTAGSISNWQDSADHDIDDDVPFKLTAKIANNFADYSTYKFVFHDKQSDGLTFKPETVEVTVGGNKLTDTQYTVDTDTDDDCTFHVVIEDLKKISGAAADAEVVVEYKSTLNKNAKIGSEGNPNVAYLEYSNNPHVTSSTTNTPDDKVTVFTFKVVANKTNGADKQLLSGAAFALFKKGSDSSWNLVSLNNATESGGVYTIEHPDQTTFEWVGLDDGEYMIKEIITPAGFNTIADQTFTVTAIHDTNSDDPQLTTLSGNKVIGEIAFSADKDSGSLTTTIENNAGTTLPGTGGIGTTIFYVIGGGLMAAAAILLITKKRMENR